VFRTGASKVDATLPHSLSAAPGGAREKNASATPAAALDAGFSAAEFGPDLRGEYDGAGMRAIHSVLGLAICALAALTGCGGAVSDATSKELSALTAEISKLRADQAALGERLHALEHERPAAGAAKAVEASPPPPAPAVRPVADDRPALDVVRLGPTSDDSLAQGDGDVDADGPRTILRTTAKGTIVEEQSGPNTTTRTVTAPVDSAATKPAAAKDRPKKSDKADRSKTAALPTP
jgi:hypothetical protein